MTSRQMESVYCPVGREMVKRVLTFENDKPIEKEGGGVIEERNTENKLYR